MSQFGLWAARGAATAASAASAAAAAAAASASATAASASSSWRIVGAVCYERLPLVTPEPEAWEAEYDELREHVDAENAREYPEGFLSDSLLRDEQEPDVRMWEPAPRTTPADAANNTRSLRRALDKRLYMVIQKKKAAADARFDFPQVVHKEGETVRRTAERALRASAGPQAKSFFISNAPMAVVIRPNDVEGFAGTKIFYFRAQHCGGTLQFGTGVGDVKFLTRDELQGVVPDDVYATMRKVLMRSLY